MATTEAAVVYDATLSDAPATMEEFPEELTPTQQEAQFILRYMLEKLQDRRSKYYVSYHRWIERNARLAEFCFTCVRRQVWLALEQGLDYNRVKAIAGSFKSGARGVYFDVIKDKSDNVGRLYIGQSSYLRTRIYYQHSDFRYRRDKPSLHYHALQKSNDNGFGLLCELPSPKMGNSRLPGMDDVDLLLNVLEMWMCLVFRCLPKQTLQEWLPGVVKTEGELGALNIQTPLENWAGPGQKRERVDLRDAEDPLVREWAEMKRLEWEGTKKETEDGVDVGEMPRAQFSLGSAVLFMGIGAVLALAYQRGKR